MNLLFTSMENVQHMNLNQATNNSYFECLAFAGTQSSQFNQSNHRGCLFCFDGDFPVIIQSSCKLGVKCSVRHGFNIRAYFSRYLATFDRRYSAWCVISWEGRFIKRNLPLLPSGSTPKPGSSAFLPPFS